MCVPESKKGPRRPHPSIFTPTKNSTHTKNPTHAKSINNKHASRVMGTASRPGSSGHIYRRPFDTTCVPEPLDLKHCVLPLLCVARPRVEFCCQLLHTIPPPLQSRHSNAHKVTFQGSVGHLCLARHPCWTGQGSFTAQAPVRGKIATLHSCTMRFCPLLTPLLRLTSGERRGLQGLGFRV